MFGIGINDVDLPGQDEEKNDAIEEGGPEEPIGGTNKRPGNHDNKAVLIGSAERETAPEVIVRRTVGSHTAINTLKLRAAKARNRRHERTQDKTQDKACHQNF